MYRLEAVSLRDRLSRLTPAPSGAAEASTATRAATLDGLRDRIRATLERSARREPPPLRAVDTVDLPFSTTETPLGPLHVRTQRLSPAHRTGRALVACARDADLEVLALLALDPRLAGCDPAGALFLDTETTGLSGGAGTVAFLVGLAWWEGGDASGLVLEQILVRELGEEAPMLERLRERVQAASLLVTFNGKSFDMPLLRTRYVMARSAPPEEPPHLDLLHLARRIHDKKNLPDGCRLVALEREVLGFERVDDVASSEIGAWYMHFLRTGDARALLGVVEHNAWDVVAMAALVGLYGSPTHEALAADDLVGVARTLHRAGALDRARAAADLAVERCSGVDALRVRAQIAKARGECGRAIADFEAVAAAAADPSVRLELAKIYEHWKKAPERALEWAGQGTGETPDRHERRVLRLSRKVERGAR